MLKEFEFTKVKNKRKLFRRFYKLEEHYIL